MKPTEQERDSPDPNRAAIPDPDAAPDLDGLLDPEAVLDAETLLQVAVRARTEADQRERDLVRLAAQWAALNPAAAPGNDPPEDATAENDPAGLLRPGMIVDVPDSACAEFAAVLGMTTLSGTDLIADAVELSHRLPRTWEQLVGGKVTAWRARRIAQHSTELTDDAATDFDAQVYRAAGRIGRTKLQALVADVMTRLMPDEAAQRAADAQQRQFVRVGTRSHEDTPLDGTTYLDGCLDMRDAKDLETAITAAAAALKDAALKDAGSTASLNLRRSHALGVIARTYLSTLPSAGTTTSSALRLTRRLVLRAPARRGDTAPRPARAAAPTCGTSTGRNQQPGDNRGQTLPVSQAAEPRAPP